MRHGPDGSGGESEGAAHGLARSNADGLILKDSIRRGKFHAF
jgi:hypothetical protein